MQRILWRFLARPRPTWTGPARLFSRWLFADGTILNIPRGWNAPRLITIDYDGDWWRVNQRHALSFEKTARRIQTRRSQLQLTITAANFQLCRKQQPLITATKKTKFMFNSTETRHATWLPDCSCHAWQREFSFARRDDSCALPRQHRRQNMLIINTFTVNYGNHLVAFFKE